MSESLSTEARRGLLALALIALLWRLVTALTVRASPLLGEDPTAAEVGLLLARGLMGLGFVVCGLLALLKVGNRASGIFALYAFCAGIHWGGPLSASSDFLQTASWLVYFTVSGMLAEAAFVHFTMIFPRRWRIAERRATLVILYLPVALGALLAIGILATLSSTAARGSLREIFFTLEALEANLYGLLGLVFILVRYLKASSEERRACGLGVMTWAAWGGSLPWIAAYLLEQQAPGVSIPGGMGSDPYTLFFLFIPAGLCYAILRSRERDDQGHHGDSALAPQVE